MSTTEDRNPSNGGLGFQVQELWRWRENFERDYEEWRRKVDSDRVNLHHLVESVKTLQASVEGLRKTIVGFALSIAASAVVFSLTVLAATGRL